MFFPILALLLMGATLPLHAQEPRAPLPEPTPFPSPAAARPSATPDESAPTKDLIDVVRGWRHKPAVPPPGPEDYKKKMIAGSPVIGYSPTSGVAVGFAGNVAFYRGYPETTRISSIVASATATSKAQFLVSAKMNINSPENQWRIEADNRFYWTSQPTYGLGSSTVEEAELDMKFNHIRLTDTYYRQLRRNFFLGLGYVYNIHNNIRPPEEMDPAVFDESPFVTYSNEFGLDLDSQTSAGFSLHALLDSRDGAINPTRGFYANTSYTAHFEDFFGGSSSWQEFSYDLRTYAKLSKNARHRLAFWTFGDLVTGGVAPYLDLPHTGGDTYSRSGRGYPQGRFRGPEMLYGEVEYRVTLSGNGLFGMVAFVNTQTLSNEQTKEKVFDSFATGAGIGFRFSLNKQSKTNLCFDIGRGQGGSKAIYFAVQEAF